MLECTQRLFFFSQMWGCALVPISGIHEPVLVAMLSRVVQMRRSLAVCVLASVQQCRRETVGLCSPCLETGSVPLLSWYSAAAAQPPAPWIRGPNRVMTVNDCNKIIP